MATQFTSPFKANLNGVELLFHNSAARYLAGVSPHLEWDTRSLSAKENDQNAKAELQAQLHQIQGFLESPEGKEKVRQFISEALAVTIGMLEYNSGWAPDQLMEKKHFTFVLGYMRTGGSYALSELCRIHGYDYRDYNLCMTHDSIPKGTVLHKVNVPAFFKLVLFDIAQYLVWVKREQRALSHVVMKSINSSFAMPMLDGIFGRYARYFVTVRHPLNAAISFRKLEKVTNDDTPELWLDILEYKGYTTPEKFDRMDFYEKCILWWKYLYEEVAAGTRIVREKAYIATYGQHMVDTLKRYAADHGKPDYEPAAMHPDTKHDFEQKHIEQAEEAYEHICRLLEI